MKYLSLFFWEKKVKNISKCGLLKLLCSMVSVKHVIFFSYVSIVASLVTSCLNVPGLKLMLNRGLEYVSSVDQLNTAQASAI